MRKVLEFATLALSLSPDQSLWTWPRLISSTLASSGTSGREKLVHIVRHLVSYCELVLLAILADISSYCELVDINVVRAESTELALALSSSSERSIKKTFTRLILLSSGASGRNISARLTNISSYRELVDIVNDFELVRAERTEFATLALALSSGQSLWTLPRLWGVDVSELRDFRT